MKKIRKLMRQIKKIGGDIYYLEFPDGSGAIGAGNPFLSKDPKIIFSFTETEEDKVVNELREYKNKLIHKSK